MNLNKNLNNEYLDIYKRFITLGIKITGIRFLPVDCYEKIYKCLVTCHKEFPKTPISYLKEIRVVKSMPHNHKNVIASTKLYGFFDLLFPSKGTYMVLDASIFSDETVLRKSLWNITKTNQLIEFVIAHEFGHVVDFWHSFGSYDKICCSNIEKTSLLLASDVIVNKAFVNIPNCKEISLQYIIEQIGEDAAEDTQEIFAEAFALHYCGIDSELSMQIIDEYRKFTKK